MAPNPYAKLMRPITLAQRLQADHTRTVMEREEKTAAAAEWERLGLVAKRPVGCPGKNKPRPLPLAVEATAFIVKVGVI